METVILLIWLAILAQPSQPVVRFCYKGPHQVTAKDCPGGVYFKAPLPTKCLYIEKEEPLYPVIRRNFCEGPGSDIVLTPSLDTAFAPNVNLQRVLFNNSVGVAGGPISPICLEDCFGDVDLSRTAEETEPEFMDGFPPITEDIFEDEADVSEKLFTYLMFTDEEEQRGKPDPRLLQLFRVAQRILLDKCGEPYVTGAFMERVFLALKWMATKLTWFTIKDMGKHEFDVIGDLLQNCLNSSTKSLGLVGSHCARSSKLSGIELFSRTKSLRKLDFKVEAKSFRWGKYDPFIDAAWMVLDFVLNFCFDSFIPNLNHHHVLQTHLESLFSESVIRRWSYPHKMLRGDHYWNVLASTADLKTMMRNLDFCAQAASNLSPYQERLDRPFPKRVYFNPAEPTTTPEPDPAGKQNVGWTGSVAEYWAWYASRGGLKGAIRGLGYCAQDSAEAAQYQLELESSCTNRTGP